MPQTIYWIGTEDQQHEERMKACRSRRKQWPDDECDRDGKCDECSYDMMIALRVPKAEFDRAVANGEILLDDEC